MQKQGRRKLLDQKQDQIANVKRVMMMEIKLLISPLVKT
jgi:hypothetical protein